LIEVGRHFARVLGREVRADGVLLTADHYPDGMLLRRRHLWPPPLPPPPLSRACSSRNERRCMRSLTRERAPSIRCRSTLFSDSSSLRGAALPAAAVPRGVDFSSASDFCARERQPASSSATSRTMASS